MHLAGYHLTIIDGDDHDIASVARVDVRAVMTSTAFEENRYDDSIESG